MQCFLVGYRGICHLSLVFSVYTRAFIPCLNLRKTYGNFGKSSKISANFRKLRKRFEPVLEELKRFMKLLENFGNSSKVFSRCFMIFQNLRKSSEVFGNIPKFSKNFRNGSKVIFICFYDF